jgi:hypothetical protein
MAKKQMKDPDHVSDGAVPDTAAPATAPPIISNSEHDLNLRATLEQQISAALDGGASAAEALAALIAETEAAVAMADAEAKSEEARMLDPVLSPDPHQAKAAMEDALIRSGRLRTLLPRLIRKHGEVEAAEQLAAFEVEYLDLEKERDELALELAEAYSDAVATLIDLFQRVADHDGKIAALHQSRPTGCGLHLDGVELTARGLAAFCRDIPSLIKATTLFDFTTGKQLWPVIVPRDMSVFAPAYPHDIRYTNRWWEAHEADAAGRRAESQRVDGYYAEQNRLREERDRKEGR